MKTPRKRITFRTPKRKTKTPTKQPKSRLGPSNITTEKVVSPFKESNAIEETENQLLESYRKENEYLRSLKSDALLIKSLFGFDILDKDGRYEVLHRSTVNDVERFIRFQLTEDDECYVYNLIDCANIELPDFLCDEISFKICQLTMFFFKVMESLICKRE